MAASNKSVMEILKESYGKKTDNNAYITHHDFLDALVDTYLAGLKTVEEDENTALEEKRQKLVKQKTAILEALKKEREKSSSSQTGVMSLFSSNSDEVLLALLIDNQNLDLEMLKYQEETKKIIDGYRSRITALSVELKKQDVKGTLRGRLDDATLALEERLMLIQTYKNIEVVILYGMAVPAFWLTIETFIVEAAHGDIAFERAGVELGLFIGLFVSISMMCIAAFLRMSLRHTWDVKVDEKFANYKKSLDAFLKSIDHQEGTPVELVELIETNITYARQNWVPFPEPLELDLVGFRTNALHDGKDVKSDERVRHGERKDAWAAFYLFESLGALCGGIWLSAYVHEQKTRARDLKPDWPPAPDTMSVSSSDSQGHMEMFGPEFMLIAVASVALLAAIAGLLHRNKQGARQDGRMVRMSHFSEGGESSPLNLQKKHM